MNALQAVQGAGRAADEAARRLGQAGVAAQGPDSRRQQQAALMQDASPPARAVSQDAGVQTSFSPQSIKVLEDAALGIAGAAKDCVQQIGQTGVDVVSAAADAIDAVGAEAAEAITSGAAALVKGVDAARAGVNSLATAAGDAVSDAAGRVGTAVESTVGYAALAALAGGALLNELV